MKFRFLVNLMTKIFKMGNIGTDPRADMYLPERLLAIGVVSLLGGLGLAVATIVLAEWWLAAVAVILVLIGVMAVLCWKNQTIRVVSDDTFVYTTFLGNQHEYRFKAITALRQNNDSMTLFVGKNKVHIESMAILSERLITLINEALQ